MDGNGRWAEARRRPRTVGHRAGVRAVRNTVESCLRESIPVLTLFAFSSENWARPATEVSTLMSLFLKALDREVDELAANGVRLNFIGAIEAFAPELQQRMRQAAQRTAANRRLMLNIAVNYGGRWDITEAARRLAERVARGELAPAAIDSELFASQLSLAAQPEPDLFIRTGGEIRISNFLLWQLAYTELYFTDTLWPDFDAAALAQALDAFRRRERRFGRTGAQLRAETGG
jgi:undecaprenyl diphosphate synthase